MKLHGVFFRSDWTLAASGGARLKLQKIKKSEWQNLEKRTDAFENFFD